MKATSATSAAAVSPGKGRSSDHRSCTSSLSSSSGSSSSSSSDHVPLVFHLIDGGKWRQLHQCLQPKPKFKNPFKFASMSASVSAPTSTSASISASATASASSSPSALCRETDQSGLTCLSLAVSYGAPLEILQLIHDTEPSLIYKKDRFGATAMHVGCLNGAMPEAVEFLITAARAGLSMGKMEMGTGTTGGKDMDVDGDGDVNRTDMNHGSKRADMNAATAAAAADGLTTRMPTSKTSKTSTTSKSSKSSTTSSTPPIDLVTELDFDQRSPLHHAVECACTRVAENVICVDVNDDHEDDHEMMDSEMMDPEDWEMDVGGNNNSRKNTTSKRRTPAASISSSSNKDFSFLQPIVKVIESLCRAAPQMIHVQDTSSSTPIDLVQISKSSYEPKSDEYIQLDRIYKRLKYISVRLYMKKKRQWEMQGVATADAIRRRRKKADFDVPGRSRVGDSTGSLSSGSRSSLSSTLTPQSGYSGISGVSGVSGGGISGVSGISGGKQSCLMNLSVLEEEDGEGGRQGDTHMKDVLEMNPKTSHQQRDERKMGAITINESHGGEYVGSDNMDVDC